LSNLRPYVLCFAALEHISKLHVCRIKVSQQFLGGYLYYLLLFFTHTNGELVHMTAVTLFQKKVGEFCFKISSGDIVSCNRFQKVFPHCPTPRLHCFLSFHWPSFRFLSFMAFFIPLIQFFFCLSGALFCFGIHFNAILGNLPSANL